MPDAAEHARPISTTRRASGWLASAVWAAARDLLTAGMKLAETHQLNAWYFRFDSRVAGSVNARLASPSRPSWP